MDLESIMLSKISQRKTNTAWFQLYVESEKQNKWTNKTETVVDNRELVDYTSDRVGGGEEH